MNDQCVWKLIDSHLLLEISFLVAGFAFVIADDLSSHEFFKSVMNILLILDLETQVVKIFLVLSCVSTILASHDRTSLSSKRVLKKIFLTCILK